MNEMVDLGDGLYYLCKTFMMMNIDRRHIVDSTNTFAENSNIY